MPGEGVIKGCRSADEDWSGVRNAFLQEAASTDVQNQCKLREKSTTLEERAWGSQGVRRTKQGDFHTSEAPGKEGYRNSSWQGKFGPRLDVP